MDPPVLAQNENVQLEAAQALRDEEGSHDEGANAPVVVAEEEKDDAEEEKEEDDDDDDDDDDEDDDDDDAAADDDDNEDNPMELSDQVRDWARAIKTAIEADPEIDNLLDFWYVQLAFVCRNDVGSAVERSRNMQYFKQEYDIRDTMEDARRTIQSLNQLFEHFIISFSYSGVNKNYILVVDMTTLDYRALQTDKAWRDYLAGIYYVKQAAFPNFECISQGITILHECQGFDFYGKFGGLGLISRLSKELLGDHPALHHSIKWFHTGVLLNLMVSMVKKLLPDELTEKCQFGCMFADRLDKCLMVPDKVTAQARNYARIIESFKERFENEASFQL